MRRRRRLIVGLAIAVIAVAALLPGLSGLDYALFELPWVLLPDETPAAPPALAARSDEQPAPLISLLPSRAPPRHVAA